MHVLILNQYGLPAGEPGITRHGDLGAELVRRGHRVTVVASGLDYLSRTVDRTGGDTERSEYRQGVRFIWLGTSRYRANDSRRMLSMLQYAFRACVIAIRARPRPHVVLASSPHLLAGLAGLVLSRLWRVRFVLEVRDFWPSSLVDLGAIRAGGPVHRTLEWLEKLLYRHADSIVVVPPYGSRRISELGLSQRKVIHVPNAIQPLSEADAASEMPQSMVRILKRATGRDIVMYAGAHGVANDLKNVIAAAGVLRQRRPERYESIAFLFVGDGQEKAFLEASAQAAGHDHMYFHGPVAKAVVQAVMRRAAILLVHLADAPVFRYGLSPNKLFDYLWAGKPVLMPGEPPVLAEQLGAGLGFHPGDPASLAIAIDQLLALPELERDEMGRRGRRAVAEKYTVTSTTDLLLRALAPQDTDVSEGSTR